jgi:hypothetical protein
MMERMNHWEKLTSTPKSQVSVPAAKLRRVPSMVMLSETGGLLVSKSIYETALQKIACPNNAESWKVGRELPPARLMNRRQYVT